VSRHLTQLLAGLQHQSAVLVTVAQAQGSVPRDAGAWMAVFTDHVVNTVGGGHLEQDAIAAARAMLVVADAPPQTLRFALGPSLGQCCGGVVHLQLEVIRAADSAALQTRLRQTGPVVVLFGGGHVGHALVRVLGELPFAVQWLDSRDAIFPGDLPPNVVCEQSEPVQSAVQHLPANARVLIMSFSHAEDLDIVAACLLRQRAQADLRFIGLIGSQTKWATFRKRLQERGFSDAELAHVTSPIGVPGIPGKAPEVIAVAVAAQLLQLGD
jgi:xanthine dehydrogenase accessory factor